MADPICRWRNVLPKQVCLFNLVLPHHTMAVDEAKAYTENNYTLLTTSGEFFRTPYQLASQLAMYYVDDGNMYVRFHKLLGIEAAIKYLERWSKLYYFPNPYTGSMDINFIQRGKPVIINNYLVNWLLRNGKQGSWDEAMKDLLTTPSDLGNTDILWGFLNRYSDVTISDNGDLALKDSSQQAYPSDFIDVRKDDRKAFFEHFNGLVKEDYYAYDKEKPIQKIYFGAPGTGKSWKVKGLMAGIEDDRIFRVTFHPDADYSSFVGTYKPVVKYHEEISDNLTEDQLAEILKNMIDDANAKSGADPVDIDKLIRYFAFKYAEYFDENAKKKISPGTLLTNASIDSTKSSIFDDALDIRKRMIEEGYIEDNGTIVYEFQPQAFTLAYIKAWSDTSQPVYLIIEEINRGNCARIFGDLFQLLDRDKDTWESEYTVKADKDLYEYLKKNLPEDCPGIEDGNLKLPSNLNIIATMNTSDQSLFPMDSAFKRRWEWEYIPILYGDKTIDEYANAGEDKELPELHITISDKSKNHTYRWTDFMYKINQCISKLTDSEDKQLGRFFIKKDLSEEEFKSKVMFYLWDDVCKNYSDEAEGYFYKYCVKGKNEVRPFKFIDLFSEPKENFTKSKAPDATDPADILVGFMKFLKVVGIGEKSDEEEDDNDIAADSEKSEVEGEEPNTGTDSKEGTLFKDEAAGEEDKSEDEDNKE